MVCVCGVCVCACMYVCVVCVCHNGLSVLAVYSAAGLTRILLRQSSKLSKKSWPMEVSYSSVVSLAVDAWLLLLMPGWW